MAWICVCVCRESECLQERSREFSSACVCVRQTDRVPVRAWVRVFNREVEDEAQKESKLKDKEIWGSMVERKSLASLFIGIHDLNTNKQEKACFCNFVRLWKRLRAVLAAAEKIWTTEENELALGPIQWNLSLQLSALLCSHFTLLPKLFFYKRAIPGLFFLLFVFSSNWPIITFENKFIIADVGVQTTDLWCWKRLLYQLSHYHYPSVRLLCG